jgi:hypothetical protein
MCSGKAVRWDCLGGEGSIPGCAGARVAPIVSSWNGIRIYFHHYLKVINVNPIHIEKDSWVLTVESIELALTQEKKRAKQKKKLGEEVMGQL